jgi:hypothetical protein
MALSDQEQYVWDRTRMRFCVTSADLPTVNPSGMWNPGDMVFVQPPLAGGPSYYECLTSTQPSQSNPQGTVTWTPVGIIGQNSNVSVATPATVAPGNNYVVVTSAGALTLPTASSMPAFSPINVINASGGLVTVTPATGQIAGAAALTVANNTGYALVPGTGTVWYSVVGAS